MDIGLTKYTEMEAVKPIELQHIQWLENHGYEVTDARYDAEWQRVDVDVLALRPDGAFYRIDFKVDNTIAKFGNIFFESGMIRPMLDYPGLRFEQGWMCFSEADIIMFWCPLLTKGYIVDMNRYKEDFNGGYSSFKSFNNAKDIGSVNFGYLEKVQSLKMRGVIIGEYEL